MEKDLNVTAVGGIIHWRYWKSYIKNEERQGREGNREGEM